MEVITSKSLDYIVSIPSVRQVDDSGTPVLCFLHGYCEAYPMDIRAALTLHGPLSQSSSPIATGCFIVVAPQLPAKGDDWYKYTRIVLDIVVEIQNKYGGNKNKTYLTGFSYGGNGVIDIALMTPDIWAGLWLVDPTRVPNTSPRRPIWLSIGELSRNNKSLFIERLNLKPATGFESGENIYFDGNLDHIGTATLAYQDERVYTWLKNKSLSLIS